MDTIRPWEVVPGKSFGRFLLGMPLSDAVRMLRVVGTRTEKAELVFSRSDPFSGKVYMHLPRLRMLLDFESHSQKLKSIMIYRFDALSLRYASTAVSTPAKPPTFRSVYAVFGPTYPGETSPDGKTYRHNYPVRRL